MDTPKFQTWTNYTSIHHVIDISAIQILEAAEEQAYRQVS